MNNESKVALSLVRIVAVFLIVSCHILQAYDVILAWWLNVGVQIFFVLSGFLMGLKRIESVTKFYKKRLIRVLKPYYIYILITITIYFLFKSESITIKNSIVYLLNLEGIFGSIDGLQHLWFLPVILICYLIVPIVQRFNISIKKNSKYKFMFLTIVEFSILQIMLFNGGYNFASGIGTFLIGYYLASRYKTSISKKIRNIFIFMAVVLMPINIYFQDLINYRNSTLKGKIFMFEFAWHHVFMGVAIFIILFEFFKKRSFSTAIYNKLKMFDEYSYEIYLTHHIYILGVFSVAYISEYKLLNIIMIVILSFVSCYMLRQICYLISNLMESNRALKCQQRTPGKSRVKM